MRVRTTTVDAVIYVYSIREVETIAFVQTTLSQSLLDLATGEHLRLPIPNKLLAFQKYAS